MRIAVMQPYLFPYIGYFQLINAVDRFVLLDDVNYIKKGWINRNRILVNGKDNLFTVPVKKISQNKRINELFLVKDDKWKTKLKSTMEGCYKKAPFYMSSIKLIDQIIYFKEQNLSKYILNSLKQINGYLGITTEIVASSCIYGNSGLKGIDRLKDICKKEKAEVYINAIGGVELYSKAEFAREGIELKFVRAVRVEYTQFEGQFVPWLSIIDLMMFNSKENLRFLLNQYEIL